VRQIFIISGGRWHFAKRKGALSTFFLGHLVLGERRIGKRGQCGPDLLVQEKGGEKESSQQPHGLL